MIWRSFVHGIFVGLGATIGVSILVGLATYLITQARVVPLLHDVIDNTNIEQVFPNATPSGGDTR
jgi:type IV secretory pathway TrbF-like protein